MNKTKLNKAITGIIDQANELDLEVVKGMKDADIGKVYINLQTVKKALAKIDKSVTANVKKRKEIIIVEVEKKILLQDKELVIKKMSAKELKEITESVQVKKVVKKSVETKVEKPVKKAPTKKKAVAKTEVPKKGKKPVKK